MSNLSLTWGSGNPGSAAQCHFHQFFPEWNTALLEVLQDQSNLYCINQLEIYRAGGSRSAWNIVSCLMDAMPSFRQAEMNAVSVLLGLTPTIIQTLGPTTVQTSVVSLRRPLLALMVALGTPAVRPQGAKELVRAVLRLASSSSMANAAGGGGGPKGTQSPGVGNNAPSLTGLTAVPLGNSTTSPCRDSRSFRRQCLETIVTYALIAGCMVNNGFLAWNLGCWCIVSFEPSTSWLPPLWIYLAGAIHLLAVTTLSRLVSKVRGGSSKHSSTWWLARAHRALRDEFVPQQNPEPLRLRVRGGKPGSSANLWFRALAWLLFVMASMHVVFGLVVLASLMFISAADATTVLGRFIVCTLVCRFVVVREESRIHQSEVILEEQVSESDFDWCTY